jgi:hypothetical protein
MHSNDDFTPDRIPVIDVHAHVFPRKILAKAVAAISTFYDDLPMQSDGSLEMMKRRMQQTGVEKTIIFTTATAKSQVASIHEYIHTLQEESDGTLIGFGTLHPDMTEIEIEAEINNILRLGLRGIKLHPDFQHIAADSSAVFSMAEKAQGRLPLLIHAGDYRYGFSHPEQIRRLALAYPKLTVIAAHFGGWSQWNKSPDQLAGLPNVYVDTSSSLAFLSEDKVREMIERFGDDHVLFGSDFPMWDVMAELAGLRHLGLPEESLRKILHDNTAALFSISSLSSLT